MLDADFEYGRQIRQVQHLPFPVGDVTSSLRLLLDAHDVLHLSHRDPLVGPFLEDARRDLCFTPWPLACSKLYYIDHVTFRAEHRRTREEVVPIAG